MPLDSVPTTVSAEALQVKRKAASGQCHVDVGFWGGVIPGNGAELAPLADAGVTGFKCFLADTGSPDFTPVSPQEMVEALSWTASLNRPLLVHAESAEAAAAMQAAPGRRYADYLATSPRGLENLAVAQVIEAARATGGHAHIVHLSSSDALPMLAADQIGEGETACKCSPPIREADNRELLWSGLRDRVLELIVSDHSPCTPDMKAPGTGDFGRAWGGIASLQLSLPLVWTQARRRGVGLGDIAAWMSAAPARLAGLAAKGRIATGYDADLCVLAPDEAFLVDAGQLHHKHPATTPYLGRRLHGVVRASILRGREIDPAQPRGQLLSRGTA